MPSELEQAKKELELGNIISYPTETVYGLGVDPKNKKAVKKLLEIKTRSSSISLIADSIKTVNSLPIIDSDLKLRLELQEKYWPGALTLIVKLDTEKINFSSRLLAKDNSIAIRVSSNKLARELASAVGGLITATSANPRDLEPAINKEQSLEYFPDFFTLESKDKKDKMPSTIYSLFEKKVIRQGEIKLKI